MNGPRKLNPKRTLNSTMSESTNLYLLELEKTTTNPTRNLSGLRWVTNLTRPVAIPK